MEHWSTGVLGESLASNTPTLQYSNTPLLHHFLGDIMNHNTSFITRSTILFLLFMLLTIAG